MLDLAYVEWGDHAGFLTVDAHLATAELAASAPDVPPDEGPEAQARLDAMLAN